MKYLIVFCCFLLAFSCKAPVSKPIVISGKAQGTYYAVTYFDKESRNFQPEFDSLFASFDLSASIYKRESIISRFNHNDTSTIADSTFTIIFNKAMEISNLTNGAFDITVMPLVNAWGFGSDVRSKMDSARVDSLLPLTGFNKVKLVNGRLEKMDPSMMIDYNAIAQGYSADLIGKFLETKGIKNYLVDVGGEVLGKGAKPNGSPWIVGIEKPAANSDDTRKIQISIPLRNRALATSGSYRKFFIENGLKYSHTIDPKTGFPVTHNVLSVSVMAEDCMTADAYATAFMVMGLDKTREFLASNKNLDVFVIYDDKGNLSTWESGGFVNQ